MARRYRTATKDARGNLWTEYTDEDGITHRVPTREFSDETGAYYRPYDDDAISTASTSGRAMYQASQLGEDAFRWAPGSVVSPEEFQSFWQRFSDPRWTDNLPKGGMTPEQYFADPRAAIRQENGQFVYRPDMAQGDWAPVDYGAKGFLGGLGEFLSSPGMGVILGGVLGGNALFGGANPLIASTGGGFLGDVAATGIEALGSAGATGGLSPSQMQWLNNSLAGEAPAGGMNVMGANAPAAGVDFAGSQVASNPFAFTPDPSMQAMLQGPSMGGYGALEGALGTAAGGASMGLPAIQSIMQTAGTGAGAAAPSLLERASQWLRSPIFGDPNGGGNGGNGGNGGLVANNPMTWGQLLGTGLTTGLGYLSAEKQADRSQAAVDRALGITEQELAARRPFSQTATNWLQNPNQFWQSDPMQEIARQTARVIGGARKENLYDNPTGQSLVMQSLAPTWLNAVTQMANLGLQNTAPLANVTGNLGLAAAQAQGAPGAVLGAGAADLFNPGGMGMQNTNNVLRSLLMQQGGTGSRLY